MAIKKNLSVPTDNYVYFHHIDKKIVIPVDPSSINDSMTASFASNHPLSRSAPIYSYQNSGPRTVQVGFTLHRDLCNEYNNPEVGDAVDELITNLNAMVLPDYDSANKIVNPPLVSLKLRDEVYIKGVVGQVSYTYNLPIIKYGSSYKYAMVDLNFSVQEITPYSASILPQVGGMFRG